MTENITPAQLRATAEEELRPLATRRVQLLSELEDLDRRIRPVVLRALDAEVSQRRISTLTAISATTIRKWAREGTAA